MWIIALGVGIALGLLVGRQWPRPRRSGPAVAPPGDPADYVGGMVPELLLRANRAAHLCLVSEGAGAAHWAGEMPAAAQDRGRVESVARLAASDGRRHLVRDERVGAVIGVGSEGVGAALLVPVPSPGQDLVDRVGDDLERFLAGQANPPPGPDRREPYQPAVNSVAGIGFDLCERARAVSGCSSLVVHRPAGAEPMVVAGSIGSDRRLVGAKVGADSLAARACDAEQPLTGEEGWDVLGGSGRDRRRGEPGVAVPLRDGNHGIGALVLLVRAEALSEADWEALAQAVAGLTPAFAAASAVKAAEDQAITDPLTGLPNRTALSRAMTSWGAGPCALLGVDIDHFKVLNDTYGHEAGDAALRHVAGIFRRALRDQDLPCRVGGEEFALWLPGVTQGGALEVAERVRQMVANTPWQTGGREVRITCSIGVASVPETGASVENLITAADAALYRAKERGRNRVEVTTGGSHPSTVADRTELNL